MRSRRLLTNVALYLVAFVVLAVVIIPLTFSILGGFRTNLQLVEDPVGLPNPWVGVNYTSILTSGPFWRQVRNSTVIALLTMAIVLPAASLAAYVIARYSFKGRELVYGLFTLGLLFPVAVAITPLFIVLRQVGLLSNPLGVALPQAAFGLPIAIIVMRPFFRAIPNELQDAAVHRWMWTVPLLLVGHAPAVTTGAQHDRRDHRRRQLERLLPPAARAHRPEPAHASDRRQQHLGAVHDRLRPRPCLHLAGDGSGARVLRRRGTPDHRRPHRRRCQGVSDGSPARSDLCVAGSAMLRRCRLR